MTSGPTTVQTRDLTAIDVHVHLEAPADRTTADLGARKDFCESASTAFPRNHAGPLAADFQKTAIRGELRPLILRENASKSFGCRCSRRVRRIGWVPGKATSSAACCGRTGCRTPARASSAASSTPAAFKRIEDRAVDEAVALQEAAGLDVITDGEMRRYAFFGHLIEALEGFDKEGGWSITFRDAQGHDAPLKRPGGGRASCNGAGR